MIVPHTSGEINALRQENGHVHWRTTAHAESDEMLLEEFLSWYAPLVYEIPRIYAQHPAGALIVMDIRTGAEEWKANASSFSSPSFGENVLFTLDASGNIVCIEKQNGRVLWVEPLPSSKQPLIWFGPVLAGSRLLLLNTEGEVLSFDPIKRVVENV